MCGYKKTSEQHFCHSDVFPVAPPASLIIYLLPYQRKPNDFRGLLVRVVRLERTVSWSQTRRDTNFAIPGYSISAMIPRQVEKSKIFLSVVIYVVKAAFVPFWQRGKVPQTPVLQGFAAFRPDPSRIRPRHSQTRRATNFAIPG